MRTIIKLTLKNAIRDPYLLFWSLLLPIAGTIGLGYFISSMNFIQRILTGMLCTSVIFYAYMTTVFTNIAQRRRGVYTLLQVTPLSLSKYIISISLGWTAIASVCSYAVLLAGMLVFKIPYSIGAVFRLLPIILLAAVGYIFLSFFISGFCKDEGRASMINNIIIMPMLFCSDAFYPLQNAPQIIQYISKINPFQYFVNGVRAALNGVFPNYMLSMVILIAVLFAALFLSVKTFKFSDV